MLKKFVVSNFKNFKDPICIDFTDVAGYQFSNDCIQNDMISKMLIYGRNATGKTHLGRAIMDIHFMMRPVIGNMYDTEFLNADSHDKYASFSYTFQIQGEEVLYRYEKYNDQKLKNEELIMNNVSIFQCAYDKNVFYFDNLEVIEAETANTERYVQSLRLQDDLQDDNPLSFLTWLVNNVKFEKDCVLDELRKYIHNMLWITNDYQRRFFLSRGNQMFLEKLKKEEKLQDFESFLNTMGIKCNLELKALPDKTYELYFKYEGKLVPFFNNASSGTWALYNIYKRIVFRSNNEASFLYLDEFDAYYHYEMAKKVINYFKDHYPYCQMIMTTHNTNLMSTRFMRPDCLFILSSKGTLTALCKATTRELREGHNLEKMYISGEFDKYE